MFCDSSHLYFSLFLRSFLGIVVLSLLASCSVNSQDEKASKRDFERIYTQEQVNLGKKSYEQNCASCHGVDAKGADNHLQMAKKGIFLPPSLNDNSMVWHRNFATIVEQIESGTIRFEGGHMPAFKDKLTREQIHQIIFYLMSLWSDETYQRWYKEVNNSPLPN